MVRARIIITICAVTITNSVALGQLPDHFDWRDVDGENWMTPVRDQGDCGSCWAFAAVGAVEAQYNIVLDLPDYDIDLSEENLVSTCFNPGFPYYCNCRGGLHNLALDFITNSGITDEACFPYVDEDCHGGWCWHGTPCTYGCTNANCSSTYRCDDWQSRLWKIDGKVHVPDYTVYIKSYIYNVGPLAVSFDFWYGYFDEDDIWRCDNPQWANHVVVLVGWDDTDEYWIAKNSWGDPDPVCPGGDPYFKIGFGQCLVEEEAYSVTLNLDTDRFYIKDSSGEWAAWFGDLGNLVIKGTLTTGVYPLEEDPDHDEFRFIDQYYGFDDMIIDADTGDVYLRYSLYENQETLTPSERCDNFIIKNSSGDIVAYVDYGALYLKGRVYESQ